MYLASKLLTFATQPLAWVLTLLILGLLTLNRRRQFGQRLIWSACLILLFTGWLAGPELLLRNLESRYTATDPLNLRQYTGIIVLGGALEPARIWEARQQAALNDAAERMTAPLPLLVQAPHLRLLFTGGEGELFESGLSEAERAKMFYLAMGVPAERLVFESASRNTYENAVLSAQVPGVDKNQPWLLVTSAWHMPRAMALFKAQGWNVTPYPVDYRSSTAIDWFDYSLAKGATRWKIALHEIAGLLAYQLAGKTSHFKAEKSGGMT